MTTIEDGREIGSGLPLDDQPLRPMRKDAARNRELLITAGREVFAKRGLDASLDDVARRAGVGVGTAYRHFANKFDLAEAIMKQVLDDILAMTEEAARADDPWDGLVGFLEAILELQTKDRGLREVMMGVGAHPQHQDEAHDQLTAPVAALLRRAQEAGCVRADAVTSDLGCVVMMLCQVADLGGESAPDLWRRYLPTLLASLRPDGPPLPGMPLTDEQFQIATQTMKRKASTATRTD
jgi:AcrR family transcriptional regulator